ncbi:MAG TPA: hypothetical protein VFP68_23945, partial [Burkholderiaceae bacterium]|nr:hypothetical protein [Burkholderiaceae bacterium]
TSPDRRKARNDQLKLESDQCLKRMDRTITLQKSLQAKLNEIVNYPAPERDEENCSHHPLAWVHVRIDRGVPVGLPDKLSLSCWARPTVLIWGIYHSMGGRLLKSLLGRSVIARIVQTPLSAVDKAGMSYIGSKANAPAPVRG